MAGTEVWGAGSEPGAACRIISAACSPCGCRMIPVILLHAEYRQLFLLQRNGQFGSVHSKGSLRSYDTSKS